MNDLCASGRQLVAQLQCALREIELPRTRASLDQLAADSPPPAIPPTIFEVVESGSCLEVVSCTDATFSAVDAPAAEANPHIIPVICFSRTAIVTTTTTQVAHSSPPRKAPPAAQKFPGGGKRLGGGKDGDDGDDDDPKDWNVLIDDTRDGNAKKKADDEEEEDKHVVPSVAATTPAGDPPPAGVEAVASLEDIVPSIPFAAYYCWRRRRWPISHSVHGADRWGTR